jgi:hypothetical protein
MIIGNNAWILEYRELAWEKVCVWVVSRLSQALPAPQKSSSRDLTATEETCAKGTSYSFKT